MIKLLDILFEVLNDKDEEGLKVPEDAYTGKVYHDSPNTWTHITRHDGIIEDIKRKGKWVSRDENLDNFVYGTQHMKNSKFYLGRDNKTSPYFLKGKLYIAEPTEKYPIKWLITTDLPDEAFQPNINGGNTDTLEQSKNIGVLKPHPEGKTAPNYRDIKNFEFYKYNPKDKKWYNFDIDKLEI